jgi:uncharacterized protein (DUF2235 family)
VALFAFDGTWNDLKTDDVSTPEVESRFNTNVVRFLQAHLDNKAFHFNGIGTRAGVVGRLVGGAFGVGGRSRVGEAFDLFREDVEPGEPVDLVGFSRGAALALAFANRISAQGARDDGRPVRIRFIGLFDVVGAFGIPFNLGPLRFQQVNLGYELSLPPTVEYCVHAMALDECRHTFRPTRVSGAHEVWFRGAHSDVGGGNGNLGLNAIALGWMLRKAAACGVPVSAEAIQAAAGDANPLAPVRWPDPDPIRNTFRTVRPSDLVHHSVMRPCLNRRYNEVPAECPTEGPMGELLAVRNGMAAG